MQTTDPTLELGNPAGTDDFMARTEKFARQEPMKAVGYAFGAGLLLTLLPIGGILGGLFRLSLGLLKPGLLILGAIKLYEEFDRRQHDLT